MGLCIFSCLKQCAAHNKTVAQRLLSRPLYTGHMSTKSDRGTPDGMPSELPGGRISPQLTDLTGEIILA